VSATVSVLLMRLKASQVRPCDAHATARNAATVTVCSGCLWQRAAIPADAKLKCDLCIVGSSATSQMGSRCGEKADH